MSTESGTSNPSTTDNGASRPQQSRPRVGPIVLAFLTLMFVPLALVFTLLALVLSMPWWLGVAVGFVVAACLTMWRLGRSLAVVERRFGGGWIDSRGSARFENLTESLSLAAGLKGPALKVISDESLNIAAARQGNSSTLFATSGLLETLEPIELEAVIAAMIVRLRSGDIETQTVAAALFGVTFLERFGGVFGSVGRWVIGISSVGDAVDRDLGATALTRYPPGLRSAFAKLSVHSVDASVITAGLRPLTLVNPDDASELKLRMDVLAEL